MTVGSGVRMSGLAQSPVIDDHEHREREVEEEHRLGLPRRGLEAEGPDGPEDRVGEQDADRHDQDRVVGFPVVGRRITPTARLAQRRIVTSDPRWPSALTERASRRGPRRGRARRAAPARVVMATAAGHRAW